jgi:hypothetical protein
LVGAIVTGDLDGAAAGVPVGMFEGDTVGDTIVMESIQEMSIM